MGWPEGAEKMRYPDTGGGETLEVSGLAKTWHGSPKCSEPLG